MASLSEALARDKTYKKNPKRSDAYGRLGMSELAARVLYNEHLRSIRGPNAKLRKKRSLPIREGNAAWRALA